MSARRPLLTATAAGTLLCALWFVPSANATAEGEAKPRTDSQQQSQEQARPSTGGDASQDLALADTGSVDTTPYLVGGTAFLGVGAGFLAFSMRRAARPVI
ncbi:hypothetical protein AR457_13355 [Streptomyces agglomeratus]|uniref:LPXTG cell wall anchor domain-containing protein n=1 Tax=Streptomyces agglomeratus TaxID=285458 RepID=A0A1E5P7E3_9ACTN|nr:hypothetical protein [Streptomyces agglomeratus]OEJ25304.1 hypothetical protein AS594_13185 [Streptomyces agglomeratus]OEJ40661.1 hypothetical protein BGK70_23295 [Streptomyces agglomeratus]OEJ44959.1 hypothetical protein AR457_13355 [Streptomyces agglomeratus]OEJ53207.1 hypothetical protein BGK72_22915 [Streptomyces agglomeratus]OEJ60543.1 hypothetical protein BGM19_23625 [Streptomyces agglomeratus]